MIFTVYNPQPQSRTILNPYNNPAGLMYVSNSSLAYWGGKWWAAFDGSTTGVGEGEPDQHCWMMTSTDNVTWGAAFKPFRDAAFCTNPGVPENPPLDWQPNLVAVDDELWCTWTHGAGFLSKLSDPEGKWTNYRFEFDGTDVYLSSTVNGAASSGRSTFATLDGLSDWQPFFACNPIVLSSGVVAMPLTLLSRTLSTQIITPSNFTKQLKRNAVIFADGDTYTLAVIDTSKFGDFSAWEPFVVENPAGHIYVYSRNMNPTLPDEDFMHVAASYDGGATFEPSISTKLFVPSTRGYAKKLPGLDRWVMTHIDFRARSNRRPRQGLSKNRINGALFTSLRGSNDFTPGVNFSGFDSIVNYPQFAVGPDGKLNINYTSGDGVNLRRSLKVVEMPALDSANAYVMPRSASVYDAGYLIDPKIKTGTPPYYEFLGNNQLRSAEPLVADSAITYTTWARSYDGGSTLCDTRSTLGSVLTIGALSITGVSLLHRVPIRPGVNFFLAAILDSTTSLATFYVGLGGGTLSTATAYYRSILFSAQPADGDTITVGGNTYTFRDNAQGGEVQIGAILTDTVANLDSILSSRAFQAFPAEIGGRLLMARKDGTVFVVTSGSSAITLEDQIPVSGGRVRWGSPDVGALSPLSGRIYDGRVYTSALSEANIRWLHNQFAEDFGYDDVTGTSSDPGEPEFWANPADPDTETFPPLGNPDPGFVEEITSNDPPSETLLRFHGESSASVELPYAVNRLTLRWRCSAAPTGTDRFTIATFGVGGLPARLYVDAADPTKLYLRNKLIGTVDPTAWNTTTLTVGTNYVQIGSQKTYSPGKPRAFLGSAQPQGLLTNTRYVDCDVAAMIVTRAVR